jgi:nicotinamide-nucleotide amidase
MSPGSPPDIPGLVERLAGRLLARGWKLATAESCTGGLIAAACTDRAGSSEWFERGLVTYSNAAKSDLLGVPATLIGSQGAVSEAVVRAMAVGALKASAADWAVAVTGIAGPGGGSPDKPVGTVWLAWAGRDAAGAPQLIAERQRFDGDRAAVRTATVRRALAGLIAALD